jgi:ferredoxin-NADP reductase
MDYPNRRRLKMFGRVRVIDTAEADTLARLADPDYPAQIERAFLIAVEGFDWNCPAHITPRFTETEVSAMLSELSGENRRLQAGLAARGGAKAADEATHDGAALGEGDLEVVISGVRQLTERVRAYELRDPRGHELPAVEPGSHLLIPVCLASGEISERHYSIASNPARRDIYEIAVQREDQGSGGSRAVHEGFELGTRLRVDPPANHFSLHRDDRPAVLIAGGIGITPIKAMAQALEARGTEFHLHYAGRDRRLMAFRDRLQRQLGDRITVYSAAEGERLDVGAVLAEAAPDAEIYVCGPDRLVSGVLSAAKLAGIPRGRIHVERFS